MEVQFTLHRQIGRFLDNFKKIGRTKYNSVIVRSRISQLQDLWQRFNEGHEVLCNTIPEETRTSVSYFTENIYERTEDLFNSTSDHLAEVLAELMPAPFPTRSFDALSSRPSASTFSTAHLPVIQVPPFDGTETEWERFRDRFTAVIIENRDLHDFARMHFLVSFLRGRALECISNLSVSADNFTIAWHTLKERYDNKRRLISVHMSTLLNLTRVTRESANDVQSLRCKVNSTLASLANLQRSPADMWNDFIVHLVLQNLDPNSRRTWTLRSHESSEPFSYEALDRFVADRIRALEDLNRDTAHAPTPRSVGASRVHTATLASNSTSTCPICSSHHFFSSCPRFLNGTVAHRRDLVRKHRRCLNCLSPKHFVSECSSRFSCRQCHQRHHSLLHDSSSAQNSNQQVNVPVDSATRGGDGHADSHSLVAFTRSDRRLPVLLATARVRVSSPNGRSVVVRALLDQGSEVTLVSERIVQLLRAKHSRISTSIRAVGCVSAGIAQYAVSLNLSPITSSFPSFATRALVLNALTSYAPRCSLDLNEYPHLAGLPWADSHPFDGEAVDLLVGADLYGELLRDGVRRGSPGQPIAQETVFGWIVSGPVGEPGERGPSGSCLPVRELPHAPLLSHHCSESLDADLRRFWEMEDIPCSPILSPEDERCELHFRSTHSRDTDGRYRVRIPFKRDPPVAIGSSRPRAERSLNSLLRRLQGNAQHFKAYSDFLLEYEALGHMRRVMSATESATSVAYIPHHPVFRAHSSTSSIRVVFNASSPTDNGTSLNDHILAGPKLQSDLPEVILRWRAYQFAYCADIEKMYRQILLDERDVDYQRILWANSPSEPPREFRLLTVTYGMACAPFLALRVINQLRVEEGHEFPLASQILKNNIYVDDVLFGGDTVDDAVQARDQLIALLSKGCFPLRKWSGNASALLSDIPEANQGLACSRTLATSDSIKVLGVVWVPAEDVFCFSVSLPDQIPCTKRAILSTIAKLFDPLGWVTPVTIYAKIFIQLLWRHKISWDEALSDDLFDRWQLIFQGLSSLENVRVPRWLGFNKTRHTIQLHGFSDASNTAYAAVVYCRVITASNEVNVTLLAGKSRVAPIKILSVPRLELTAAVLLSRLLDFVRRSLSLGSVDCYCWSDSRIVLTWLSKHPSTWKTFVAHRVQDIHTRLPAVQWRYVPTQENPADCASRGLFGADLASHSLWWHGPPWLILSDDRWPSGLFLHHDAAEVEHRVVTLLTEAPPSSLEMFERCSSWPRLIRVVAYMGRFISACRRPEIVTSGSAGLQLALTAGECSDARLFVIRALQKALFPQEIRLLSNHSTLPSSNSILSLAPFLDDVGVIRVGGRISRSPLPFSARHPILLSAHYLTDLIIDNAHLRALHAGAQLTLSVLRRDFWIVRARSVVRKRIFHCVTCVRERASVPAQLMSDLPRERVTAPSRAFIHVGVDYAGPVHVRSVSGRGSTARKAYISLFICLATRAIHLELVSDYSSQAFLGAFARFSARRGLPKCIYSDNGTTFVGAERELHRTFKSAIRNPHFLNSIASDGVDWKFIPPSAPHFGGLWESGVKSVKHHMRRVMKSYTLTIEEFSTLLCNIEACLNSRPIAPLSDDMEDYEPLTPGHFLIGSALLSRPEPSLLDFNENRLTRWQTVRRITENFWRLWSNDYVTLLQQRFKWKRIRPPLKVGQLVLIRNSNLPPCKWELGRITQCHPGADGLTRVVTIKTASSELTRPIVKLCVLPVNCAPNDDIVTPAHSF